MLSLAHRACHDVRNRTAAPQVLPNQGRDMTTEPPGPPASEPDPTSDPSTGTPPETGSSVPPAGDTPSGYTPPPAGSPPAPPPPPPGGGYPPPPPPGPPPAGAPYVPSPTPLAAGVVVKYAWSKFKANPAVWIIGILALIVIEGILQSIFAGIGSSASGRFLGVWSVASIIGTLVSTVIGYFVQAAITQAALEETSGVKATFQSFMNFKGVDLGQILIASIVIGLATSIGTVLCILPGIAVALLSCFVLPFILEGKQDAMTAIKSSWNLWSKNFGTLIGPGLALFGLVIAGFIVCGIGALITLPLAYIGINYGYRVLTNKPIG